MSQITHMAKARTQAKMQATTQATTPATRTFQKFDVFGPTIEFILHPEESSGARCVMQGEIAPGAIIPLHSHDDFEIFIVMSGRVEALREKAGQLDWTALGEGDVLQMPPGAKHAFRNVSGQPAVLLIIATARIGRFVLEVGREIAPDAPAPLAPSPERIQHFLKTSARYGCWLGTPEENAAVGLRL